MSPVATIRDLGICLDADVFMAAHVTATVRACLAALHHICSVWSSLLRHAVMTLIRALVVSKLDYCNHVLVVVSTTLQRVLSQEFSTHNTTPP